VRKKKVSQGEVLALAKDLMSFGGRRTIFAILLMLLAGILESISLAFLVPLFAVLTSPNESGFIARMFALALPAGASLTTKLGLILLLFALVMVIRTIVVTLRDRKIGLLQMEYSERLQVRLFEGLAHARWQDIEGLKHARITQALGPGMARVTSAAQLLLQAAVSLAMLLAQWLMTLLIAPAVALIVLAIGIIGAVPLARALGGSTALGRQMSSGSLSLVHTTSQLLGGLKLSFAQNMQPAFVDEYATVARELKNRRYAFLRGQSMVRAMLTLGAALAGALLLFIGFVLGTAVAPLLASFAIFARMNTAAVSFISCAVQLANNAPAHDDLMALFKELEGEHGPAPRKRTGSLPAMKAVEFDNVTFGSETEQRLKGLNVVLHGGEILGVTGASGAGKTTFLDAVTGLLRPDAGTIRHNGIPMDETLAHLWRDKISYVPQESFLLNESVRKNLTWGRKELADETLWETLTLVHMDGVVKKSAEGLDTQVSERGIRFSGGERQRIALARALLRDPEVLILDEATSAIDIDTEVAIFERLAAARPELTIIVVAHRPSTLAMCDRIIRLEEGRLLEDSVTPTAEPVAR
jgi:ATP-binding cassette subfamily C protein